MTTFGAISYEDFSLLNAEWSQARPPMAGLGATFGQHEYRDVSYLNARLRPIMPKQVGLSPDGLGGGSLSGNSLGMFSGLGADTIPWISWYNSATADEQDEFDEAAHIIDAGGSIPSDVSGGVHAALVLYKSSGGRDALTPESTVFTSATITAAQNLVNTALAKAGYQTIGVDGKLGPATCGALIWYQKNVDSKGGLSFMAECDRASRPPREPIKLSSGGGGGGGETTPPVDKKSPAQANMLLYGGAFAAIAIGGALIYRASKKR